ncbi:MAG: methyl-accepting chemotaxis protein, partial [Pseudomonadota bacterium]|nr:methyl-accepting chemotaxis protein [Pseudomonadota bacterium]
MRITISTKIIAGYALAIVLSLGILVVGLLGINRINEGLGNIVNESMPMIQSVGEATNSMLTADLDVMRFIRLEKLQWAQDIEDDINHQQQLSSELSGQIQEIASNHPQLSQAAQPIGQQFADFYSAAKATIDSHRQSLEKHAAVVNQREAAFDLSDTLVDITYDIQAHPLVEVEDALIEASVRMQSSVDFFLDAVTDALNEGTLDATESAENLILNELENLEVRTLAILETAGLSEDPKLLEFKSLMKTEFKEALLGGNGVLNKLRNEINQRHTTEELKSEMDIKSLDLRNTLMEFSALVEKISDEEIRADAESAVTNSTRLLTVFSIIVVLALSAIAFLITQSIRKPLKHIVDNILQVATGDLRRSFKVESNDELGDLSQSMQQLVDTLRSMIDKINTNSSQLATTAASTTEISSSSYNNINNQTEQTSRVAVSVQEMSATVADVAQSVSNTLEQVESTHNDVNNGEQLLHSNIEDINHLAQNIEHGSQVIERLNENTNSIGSILYVIRGIAEQTNLLALNAAIEAARAGEQGRGFAVVADEVRTLASRTQDSTAEIQEMIIRLQQGAKEAVSTMSQSREDAQNSAEKIAEAGRMLSEIARSVDVIKDMSTQIASATEEQSQTAREQS